ncbi:mutator type transposase, partial [Tanacetum coccineum]
SDQDVKELLKYVVRNKVIEQRKETKVEASGNEAEYFDPFEDLNDILGQYSNENKGRVEAWRKSILANLDVIDLDSFGNDLENEIDTKRRKVLRELRKQGKSINRGMFDLFVGQRFDNRELVKDSIRKHSVESRRRLSNTNNDNERARATCVGTMPTYNSFDPDLDFSQASNGGRIIKKRQENGKVKDTKLDGCFMKGPYSGQILTVVGVDTNKGIYPVADAVVEAETKSSWCWFLKLLGLDLDIAENSSFTFISDRQKIIHEIILFNLFYLQWRGGNYKELLWKAATATTIVEFKKKIKELKAYSVGAYDYLKQDFTRNNGVDSFHMKWELTGLPCKHGVAAVWNAVENGLNASIPEDWVHLCYRLKTWEIVYSYKINPLNGPRQVEGSSQGARRNKGAGSSQGARRFSQRQLTKKAQTDNSISSMVVGFAAALAVLVTRASQSRQHESRKPPTAELFDVDSGRISIVIVNTKEYHSDVLAIITRIMHRTLDNSL